MRCIQLSVTKFDFLNLRKHSWKTFCPSQKFVYSSTTFCILPGHANWDEDVIQVFESKLTQYMNYLTSQMTCHMQTNIDDALRFLSKTSDTSKKVALVLGPRSWWPITWIKDWLIAPVLILPSPIPLPPAEIQAVEGGRPFRHHRINFWPTFSSQGDQVWRAPNSTWGSICGREVCAFSLMEQQSLFFVCQVGQTDNHEDYLKNKALMVLIPHKNSFADNTKSVQIHPLQNSCLCRTVGERGKVFFKFWLRL